MKNLYLLISIAILCSQPGMAQNQKKVNVKQVEKTSEEWKQVLTPHEFTILRLKGTDRPGNGGYTKHFEKGTYHCAGCNQQLFASNSKYDSDCGWPSFDDALEGTVKYVLDKSHGMIRTEIICAACDGHLGHVFNDGPTETTGKRYCVNSTSIKFFKHRPNKKSK